MQAYLARRAATFFVSLWVAVSAAYVALAAIPGDPAQFILGIDASPEALAALRAQLGLDLSVGARYVQWFKGVLTGHFGHSVAYDISVGALLWERMQVTLPLGFGALFVAALVAVPGGVWAAAHAGRRQDALISALSQVGLATPTFWLGIWLMALFAVRLGWLPSGGFVAWSENPGQALASLVLPALTLGLSRAAPLLRIVRAAVMDVLDQDYVRTARAKGVPEGTVLWRHGLRCAIGSVATALGLEATQLLAGSIVVESVFSLPGAGSLALYAISSRDLPLIAGTVAFMAAGVLLVSLLVDIAYAMLDPRIRYG